LGVNGGRQVWGAKPGVQSLKQAEAKGCPGDWRVYNRYKVFESEA